MGKVIAVASGKGGTGKTFFTLNLGVMLAESGKKVLLVDTDTGAPTLDINLDLQQYKRGDFIDIMLGEKTFYEVVLQDEHYPNLFVIPGSVTGNNVLFDEEDMRTFCMNLKEQFDYIFLDCPSGSNINVCNVIAGADEVIMLVLSTVGSVRNADILVTKLMKDGFFDISFVLNRMNEKLVETCDMMTEEDVIEILEIPLLGSLPEDERVVISLNNCEAFVRNYPDSIMTTELKAISNRITSGLFYKFMIR